MSTCYYWCRWHLYELLTSSIAEKRGWNPIRKNKPWKKSGWLDSNRMTLKQSINCINISKRTWSRRMTVLKKRKYLQQLPRHLSEDFSSPPFRKWMLMFCCPAIYIWVSNNQYLWLEKRPLPSLLLRVPMIFSWASFLVFSQTFLLVLYFNQNIYLWGSSFLLIIASC